MTHETARDAADRYLIGLYTFSELDKACQNDGLRDVRLLKDGSIRAIGGKGFNTYTITLAG